MIGLARAQFSLFFAQADGFAQRSDNESRRCILGRMTFALDIKELTLRREEPELIRALSLQVKPGELIRCRSQWSRQINVAQGYSGFICRV